MPCYIAEVEDMLPLSSICPRFECQSVLSADDQEPSSDTELCKELFKPSRQIHSSGNRGQALLATQAFYMDLMAIEESRPDRSLGTASRRPNDRMARYRFTPPTLPVASRAQSTKYVGTADHGLACCGKGRANNRDQSTITEARMIFERYLHSAISLPTPEPKVRDVIFQRFSTAWILPASQSAPHTLETEHLIGCGFPAPLAVLKRGPRAQQSHGNSSGRTPSHGRKAVNVRARNGMPICARY